MEADESVVKAGQRPVKNVEFHCKIRERSFSPQGADDAFLLGEALQFAIHCLLKGGFHVLEDGSLRPASIPDLGEAGVISITLTEYNCNALRAVRNTIEEICQGDVLALGVVSSCAGLETFAQWKMFEGMVLGASDFLKVEEVYGEAHLYFSKMRAIWEAREARTDEVLFHPKI